MIKHIKLFYVNSELEIDTTSEEVRGNCFYIYDNRRIIYINSIGDSFYIERFYMATTQKVLLSIIGPSQYLLYIACDTGKFYIYSELDGWVDIGNKFFYVEEPSVKLVVDKTNYPDRTVFTGTVYNENITLGCHIQFIPAPSIFDMVHTISYTIHDEGEADIVLLMNDDFAASTNNSMELYGRVIIHP